MNRSDNRINHRIDTGIYDRSALVILKVPMHLPYFTDWKDYERAEGEIEMNGIHYTYVEKKFSQDTLYLACLPNLDKTVLSKAKHSYASDQSAPNTKKQQDTGIKKGMFGSEYYDPIPVALSSSRITNAIQLYHNPSAHITSAFIAAPFTPPDMA